MFMHGQSYQLFNHQASVLRASVLERHSQESEIILLARKPLMSSKEVNHDIY